MLARVCEKVWGGGSGFLTPALIPRQATLNNALCSGAQLAGADLSGASLAGATLSKATLSGANLTDAVCLRSLLPAEPGNRHS